MKWVTSVRAGKEVGWVVFEDGFEVYYMINHWGINESRMD